MKTTVFAERVETVVVVASGEQGPAGAPGPIGPTGGSALSYVAATPIGGHRVVALNASAKVIYADNTQMGQFGAVLGISLGAANADASVDILRMGEIEEPSWSWLLGQPVFLGTNGLLTQTPPTTGFSLVVGFPVAPTRLFVSFREPVIIS